MKALVQTMQIFIPYSKSSIIPGSASLLDSEMIHQVSALMLGNTHLVSLASPRESLTIGHGQHLLGRARLDTILRMTAEWERAQMMTEEASKNSRGQSQLARLWK